MDFVTRFAPSPTGYLHLGHAYSALTAFDASQRAGGRFLLRIEDIDQGRARPEFDTALVDDLAWLGLRWETPVRRQSDHLQDYATALDALAARDLVYRCFRTRAEILRDIASAPHGRGDVFFGARLSADEEEARRARGDAFAWRLDARRAADTTGPLPFEDETGRNAVDPLRLGDAVLGRKDFPASYHLAATHDDALQGVTHVIRGEDLRDAAHLHRVLQALFGCPAPIYAHHGLILGADGARLAKRDRAQTLRSLRADGATPQDIRARIGL